MLHRINPTNLTLIAALWIAALPSPLYAGRTLYVSPSGDDAHAGTREQPWKSPGFASRQLKPGDTLIVRPGRYVLSRYDDDILMPPSGTPDGWITIKGEPGSMPVLAGRDNLTAAIVLDGARYVRIENLEITHDNQASGDQGRFREAIHLCDRPGGNIVLARLHIHHLDEFGVNIQDVDGLELTDCRVRYCGGGAVGGPAGTSGGWRNVVIRKCDLSYSGHYFQGGDGSKRPYDRPDGFGIEPSRGPIEIVDTSACHNRGDGLDSKAEKTSIRHCTVANNSCDGIKLWGTGSKVEHTLVYGTGDGLAERSSWSGIVLHNEDRDNAQFELTHVTLWEHPDHVSYQMYVQYGVKRPLALTVRNCIFGGGSGAVHFGENVRLTAENSLFFRTAGETPVHVGDREYTAREIERGALGPGNRSRDPRFVHPDWGRPGDFHLRSDSPCIDAGKPTTSSATDLDGKRRPCGKSVDMGCYEWEGGR